MSTNNTPALVTVAPSEIVQKFDNLYGVDVGRVIAQTHAVQRVMKALMQEGVHYGKIPGTDKPSLWQAGADKLCLLFRLRPEFKTVTVRERDEFISLKVRCRLVHVPTGEIWGEGIGSANSREDKYLKQIAEKVCPKCDKPAIIKGKKEYGGGWVCWQNKDGCGAKFSDGDPSISNQIGQLNTNKVWNLHNTITKIACKRAKVSAVLSATAASDIFTQDLEDLEDAMEGTYSEPPGTPPGEGHDPKQNGQPKAGEKKKATPNQVRDLNLALGELKLGVADADDQGLRGREREDFILLARMQWLNEKLGKDRAVKTMQDLSGDDAELMTRTAKQELSDAAG